MDHASHRVQNCNLNLQSCPFVCSQVIAWDATIGPAVSINIASELEPASSKMVWTGISEKLLIGAGSMDEECFIRISARAIVSRPSSLGVLAALPAFSAPALRQPTSSESNDVNAAHALSNLRRLASQEASDRAAALSNPAYVSESVLLLSEIKDACLCDATIEVSRMHLWDCSTCVVICRVHDFI